MKAKTLLIIEGWPKNWDESDSFNGDLTIQSWQELGWHIGYNGGDGWYEGPEVIKPTLEEAILAFNDLLNNHKYRKVYSTKSTHEN